MTSYRLFPATPGPATAVAFGPGNFIAGVAFAVAGGGRWFEGYWWWVAPSGQSTSPVKCALWSATSSSAGAVVSGSVVTSGTLTAGQWNFIPLPVPVQLAPSLDPSVTANGSCYIAAVGVNGSFPDTLSQFNAGDTYAAGITSGPLTAYSGTTGSKPAPYGIRQGLFSVAGSDPSTSMPNQGDSSGDGGSNFWVDVQVGDTPPAGYSGSWRLWPNKGETNPALAGDSAVNYTVGTEVHLLSACTLNKAWYYSQAGAANLATRAAVWSLATGLEVAVIASPSWSGAAGSGWVSASFAGGVTLPAGSYIVSVFDSSGTAGSWAPKDASTNYWGQGGSGGVGSSGITAGPLYAPPQPSAALGYNYSAGTPGSTPPYTDGTRISAQPPFGQDPGGGTRFPQLYAPVGGSLNQSQNYWVDLEVTPLPPAYPFAVTAQRRQAWPRGLPRRGRLLPPVRAQLSPPYPFAEIAQRRQAHPRALARRGRQARTVPAQVNPPYPFAELRQQRRPRGFFPRTGRRFAPVPPQQAAAPNPALAFQPQRHPRITAMPRRARLAQPLPQQAAAPAPARVGPHRAPARALALIRRRFGQLLPWPQAERPSFTVGALTASAAPAAALTATTSTTGGPS